MLAYGSPLKIVVKDCCSRVRDSCGVGDLFKWAKLTVELCSRLAGRESIGKGDDRQSE